MSVCVVGAINLDLVARVRELPRPGETVMASGLAQYPGGKGLNQAVAAARAGAQVRMIGRVGADTPGDWLLAILAAEGIDATGVSRDVEVPTGQALITVSDAGENCIVVVAGANGRLVEAPVEGVAGARVLLAQLETAIDPIAALFAADLPGCLKVLNAAPAEPDGAKLFAHCDLLILNETEAAAYARIPAPLQGVDAAARAAGALSGRAGRSVVVTLGAAGVLVVEADGVLHVPGRPARVVDTVGAGDCFCGVLTALLSEGLPLIAAVERANAAGALAVTRPGAANAMPTRAEIEQAMVDASPMA